MKQPVPIGIYIHIPFCLARCSYCDFITYAGLGDLLEDYVQALCQEIRSARLSAERKEAITVYVGGGTPSLLSSDQVGLILAACYDAFRIADDVEITMEANPGTVTAASLSALRRLGVNRLSLGGQSFDDAMLRTLGRLHTAEQAREAYMAARQAGFDNVGLDLIYGLPGQTLEHWQATLNQAIALGPDHLSLYALTLEEDVPMARSVARGELTLPDDDTAADMYILAEAILEHAGFLHYEISNWAAGPAKVSRHNTLYWRRQPYRGFGAGAHSFVGEQRWANVAHPKEYIDRIRIQGSAVDTHEDITPPQARVETMFLGLRLVDEGMSAAEFTARCGQSLTVFSPQIHELIGLGLLENVDGRLRLTQRGRLLGNQVFVQFML